MDIRKLFGQNVSRLRKERDMKQEALAAAAGIGQPYLSQIENGQVNLTLLGVNDLVQALEVKPEELFRERE
jgi:transcriptional regulator with XRE-family HTH domain